MLILYAIKQFNSRMNSSMKKQFKDKHDVFNSLMKYWWYIPAFQLNREYYSSGIQILDNRLSF